MFNGQIINGIITDNIDIASVRPCFYNKRSLGLDIIYHFRDKNKQNFIHTSGYKLIKNSELLPGLNIEKFTEYVKHSNPLTAAKEFRKFGNK